MATHDYNLANQSGASFRSDLNNALAAVLSNNSGSTSPSTTVAYMLWADTNTNKLKIRNTANDAWVELINLDGTIARDLTLTGASANIVFDQSDNELNFADSAKATFGTDADLSITHIDGTGNIIDSQTGDLFIRHHAENMLICKDDGAVEMYFDNELRLTTKSSGIDVSRPATTDQNTLTFLVDNLSTNASSETILRLRVRENTAKCRLQFGDQGNQDVGQIIYDHSNNEMTFHTAANNRYVMDSEAIFPSTDNADDLGKSNRRFDDVRATNGTIQTSDKNTKNTITATDLGLDFVNKLTPVSYKFNTKTRTHYGLIAQDIETLLGTIGKSATDFAGFCKDEVDSDGNALSEALYGLRYTEFIAPIIKAIQELSAKVSTLEGS